MLCLGGESGHGCSSVGGLDGHGDDVAFGLATMMTWGRQRVGVAWLSSGAGAVGVVGIVRGACTVGCP